MYQYKLDEGVSMCIGSNRYPGTVIGITKSGKTVTVQEDDAHLENQDGLGVFGNQRYRIERNEKGIVRVFRYHRSKDGFYADGMRLNASRSAYFDPHF